MPTTYPSPSSLATPTMKNRVLRGEDSPPPPNETSQKIMAFMDSLSSRMRELIHEYGFTIVTEMDADNMDVLEMDLQVWRERRQEAIGRCQW